MVVNSQTVTAFQITLILTEEEARHLMVDADEFQTKLRHILQEHDGENFAKHLNGSNGKTIPKGLAPGRTLKRGTPEQCKICGRMIANQFMPRHMTKHAKASVHAAVSG